MPDKNISYKNSWLSQFGLYRYENSIQKQSNPLPTILVFALFGLFFAASLLLFLVINSTFNEDPPQVFIFAENYSSTVDPEKSRRTSLAYINNQLERFQNEEDGFSMTTPMGYGDDSAEYKFTENSKEPRIEENDSDNKHKKKRFLQYRNHRMDQSYPDAPNHRRNYNEKPTGLPRPFKHVLTGEVPSAFHVRPNHSFPNIPKEYSGQVDSIQDIIEKMADQIQSQRSETLPEYVARAGRKVRFGGTYRHRKKDDKYELRNHTKQILQKDYNDPSVPFNPSPPAISDPFYPFKPLSMADVNLMAMNEFRFAPNLGNEFEPTSNNRRRSRKLLHPASDLIKQYIKANNLQTGGDRTNSREGQSKTQKPFSLMLDVYPLHDEDPLPVAPPTTTSRPAIRPVLRKPLRRPVYDLPFPLNGQEYSHHYPSLHQEQQYFKNMKFPQIPPYRMNFQNIANDAESYNNRESLNYNFQRFGDASNQNPKFFQGAENRPSQITVHLNLFPNHHRQRLRDKLDSDGNSLFQNNQEINQLKNRILHQATSTIRPYLEAETNLVEVIKSTVEPRLTSHRTDVNNLIPTTAQPLDNNKENPHASNSFEPIPHSSTKQPSIEFSISSSMHPHQTPFPISSSPFPLNIVPIDQPSFILPRRLPPYRPTIIPTVEPGNNSHQTPYSNKKITFTDHYNYEVPTIIPIEPRQNTESPFSFENGPNIVRSVNSRMDPLVQDTKTS